MEVNRTVLDLDDDIVGKLSVEGHELLVGLVGTVAALGIIYEGSPHHNTLVWLECTSQHVRTISVRTSEVLRAGFPLRVSLHQEATEVGYELVDLIHLVLPPLDDIRIKRVGSLQSAHLNGRGEVDGQIDANTIGTQLVGNTLGLLQTLGGECLRLGVHIVEHRTVDTHRRIGTGVHLHPLRGRIQKDALTREATLHRTVGIIPVVQDTQVVEGLLRDIQMVHGLIKINPVLCDLLQAQQVVGTVEQSCIVRSRDYGLPPQTLDGVAIFGQALLSFQNHRSALPVGLQFGHGRTLDSCDC